MMYAVSVQVRMVSLAKPGNRSWRIALAQRPSVRSAVLPDYQQRLRQFLLARDSELSRQIAGREALHDE